MFAGRAASGPAFWPGSPTREAMELYEESLGTRGELEFSLALESDTIWIPGELRSWRHPEGLPLWNTIPSEGRAALDGPGVFADCDDVGEVHRFDWPNPAAIDFTETIALMRSAREQGLAVLGGPWSYITTIVSEFFGMEDFLVKLYTDPDVMHAVVGHVVDFYMELNARFFREAGDALDVFFFASDMGTQQDLLFSPEQFDVFFRGPFARLIELAKGYGYPVLLHSCGAVSKLIPRLLDIGIDGLHPLQANAQGMQAELLGPEYRDRLVFVGGVDTQELLPTADPARVRAEVHRLIDLFGGGFVASPSHEGVLPNVSLENLVAIREGVQEHERRNE
jgi:uroporphyrinogen decarboxylase